MEKGPSAVLLPLMTHWARSLCSQLDTQLVQKCDTISRIQKLKRMARHPEEDDHEPSDPKLASSPPLIPSAVQSGEWPHGRPMAKRIVAFHRSRPITRSGRSTPSMRLQVAQCRRQAANPNPGLTARSGDSEHRHRPMRSAFYVGPRMRTSKGQSNPRRWSPPLATRPCAYRAVRARGTRNVPITYLSGSRE